MQLDAITFTNYVYFYFISRGRISSSSSWLFCYAVVYLACNRGQDYSFHSVIRLSELIESNWAWFNYFILLFPCFLCKWRGRLLLNSRYIGGPMLSGLNCTLLRLLHSSLLSFLSLFLSLFFLCRSELCSKNVFAK